MRRMSVAAIAIALCVAGGRAQSPSAEPYKVLKTAKVGGAGGFDYVYADVADRRLYIPRGGAAGNGDRAGRARAGDGLRPRHARPGR